MNEEVQLVSTCHHTNVLEAMWKLRAMGHLCDITVQVDFQGDLEEFDAHQVVLAASSGYFRTLLLKQEPVKKIFLCDLTTYAFTKFLEYVYTGRLEVDKNRTDSILKMAKLLDCQDLIEACEAEPEIFAAQEPSDSQEVAEPQNHVVSPSALSPEGNKQQRSARRAKKRALALTKKSRIKRKRKEIERVSEDQTESQGRRSNRLAGRRVFVGIPSKKVVLKSQSDLEESDSSLSQEESEPTQRDECKMDTQIAGEEEMEPCQDGQSGQSDSFQNNDPYMQDNDTQDSDYLPNEDMEEEGTADKESKRGDARYNCEQCGRSFHYEKSFLKHAKVNHGVQTNITYRCEICQQTFANRCNLKIHERHVHNDERLFTCDVCGKAFKRKKDVTRHRRQVHEGGSERHFCPTCGKALSSKTALTLHERTHTGDKPYKCTECDARFSQSSALKTHQRIHTGEKPFSCDQCDARFTQNHMLAYHKRCHTGEKPFMCENCGKSFASKEYLKHHARIHSGSRPYKCELCERAFAQRNSLHQHMKIHTGERPYHCKDCDKQFTQLNALQRHQRIHTGEKPYMCSMCGRTFTDMSTVRRHTMTHDKDTPWKNYLVVLEGNVEDRVKKPKGSSVKKEKAVVSMEDVQAAERPGAEKTQEVVTVSGEPLTITGDWAGPGTIAVVSHTTLGSYTVIQTEMPIGTQLQPIVTADGVGASVISLEGSTVGVPVTVPFPIPISMGQSISVSAPLSGSVPVTVSEAILAPVSSAAETPASGAIIVPAVTLSSSTAATALPLLEGAPVCSDICVTLQSADLQMETQQATNTDPHPETAESMQADSLGKDMEMSTGDAPE